MAMLFLLMVLSNWITPDHQQFVTVGNGFWCDHEPRAINQVISEFQQVAITSQEVWPPLKITHGISITGGFADCLDAKLGHPPSGYSRLKGSDLLPVISIDSQAKPAAAIELSYLIIESGTANNGAGILADGHFQLSLNHVLIQNNSATQQGGAMLIAGQSNSLNISNTVLQNNQAKHGAGLAIEGSGHLITIKDSFIQHNEADISGGGILCNGLHLIKLQDSQVSGNNALWGQEFNADILCQIQSGQTDFKLETGLESTAVN